MWVEVNEADKTDLDEERCKNVKFLGRGLFRVDVAVVSKLEAK